MGLVFCIPMLSLGINLLFLFLQEYNFVRKIINVNMNIIRRYLPHTGIRKEPLLQN